MPTVFFVVAGTPRPQPRPRARVVGGKSGRAFAHIYTPDGPANAFREAVLRAARAAEGFPQQPWSGPVFVDIAAYFTRPSTVPPGQKYMLRTPDADNVVKAVMDALTPPPLRSGRGKRRAEPMPQAIIDAHRRGYPWIDDAQVQLRGVQRLFAVDGRPLTKIWLTPL